MLDQNVSGETRQPLDFAAIQAATAARCPTTDVAVPEFGGQVRLRRLGAAPSIALGQQYQAMPKTEDGQPKRPEDLVEFYVLLIVNSAIDAAGEPLFPGEEGKQFLRAQPLSAIQTLGLAAIDFNGLSESTSHVEAAKKNSLPTPTGAAPSDSPSPPADST